MIGRILSTFFSPRSVPILSVSEISSYDDYIHYCREYGQTSSANLSFESSLIPNACTNFTHHGYCYVCGLNVNFLVDFQYSYNIDGVLVPNWRERLVCPICGLNNRMRAVVHIFNQECHPKEMSRIYITEQTTPLFKFFKRSFPFLIGSEYLRDSVNHGSSDKKGIRNEDLTQLSFGNKQFDYVLSFDVFEHIPDYKIALAECSRCLKPGGILFFSIPFVRNSKKNVVRASVTQEGKVIHLLPPEYHGNPIDPDGSLCFYHFGWELLDDLKTVGFKDSKALLFWSKEFGYLGGEQLVFAATAASL